VDRDETEARAVQQLVAHGDAERHPAAAVPGGRFDLSEVRIHADEQARHRADEAGAAAVTIGSDVHLGSGSRPGTASWRGLLAHELTHVAQQRRDGVRRLQRAPDDEAEGGKVPDPAARHTKASGGGDLELPWTWGDYRALEVTSSGIRFLIALGETQVAAARAVVPALAARISADNTAIADPARRVRTCFITPATTRFTYWGGRPVLLIDPADADVGTAAHEMGHAIFDALSLQGARKPAAGAAPSARPPPTPAPVRIADLYLRLKATKVPADSTVPVGLMMVDPSEWAGGAAGEHPWQDADEFFASAKAAYQTNRTGLAASIARAAKADPAVGPLGKELLALLPVLLGGRALPPVRLPQDRASAAVTDLARVKPVAPVEQSAAGSAYPLLGWLLDPDSRPGGRPRPGR
jgi:hypothetical protein